MLTLLWLFSGVTSPAVPCFTAQITHQWGCATSPSVPHPCSAWVSTDPLLPLCPFIPGLAGEVRLHQDLPHTRFMPRTSLLGISEAWDDQWKASALQWVWVCPTSLAIPSIENRRAHLQGRLLAGCVCPRTVLCSCCLYAAARWPSGSPTASFGPCPRGTQCWRASQEVQDCALGQGGTSSDQLSCSPLLQ